MTGVRLVVALIVLGLLNLAWAFGGRLWPAAHLLVGLACLTAAWLVEIKP